MGTQQQDNYEAMIKSQEGRTINNSEAWFLGYCRWYGQMCDNAGIKPKKRSKKSKK